MNVRIIPKKIKIIFITFILFLNSPTVNFNIDQTVRTVVRAKRRLKLRGTMQISAQKTPLKFGCRSYGFDRLHKSSNPKHLPEKKKPKKQKTVQISIIA